MDVLFKYEYIIGNETYNFYINCEPYLGVLITASIESEIITLIKI